MTSAAHFEKNGAKTRALLLGQAHFTDGDKAQPEPVTGRGDLAMKDLQRGTVSDARRRRTIVSTEG